MLSLYIISAIVGGALILVSIFGGHGDSDTDIDHDVDHDFSAGHEGDAVHSDLWLPFFSLRFYTYGFTFFGLTGLLFEMFKVEKMTGFWLALALGVVCGLMASATMYYLSKTSTTSGAEEKDLVGADAKVLVPVKRSLPGKIRCTIKGDMIDVIAVSDEETEIPAGERVMIVAMENQRARVVRRSDFFEDLD